MSITRDVNPIRTSLWFWSCSQSQRKSWVLRMEGRANLGTLETRQMVLTPPWFTFSPSWFSFSLLLGIILSHCCLCETGIRVSIAPCFASSQGGLQKDTTLRKYSDWLKLGWYPCSLDPLVVTGKVQLSGQFRLVIYPQTKYCVQCTKCMCQLLPRL